MHRKIWHAILIGLGAAAFSFLIWQTKIVRGWENSSWDLREQLFAKPSPLTAKIKVISLDDSSLNWMKEQQGYDWPWPRPIYNEVIKFCKLAGVKALAFDVLFIDNTDDKGEANDQVFAAAIKAGPPFVGAMFPSRTQGDTSWPSYAPLPLPRAIKSTITHASSGFIPTFPLARFPIKPIAKAVTLLGSVQGHADFDGSIRRVHLFHRFADRLIPTLSTATALAAGDSLPEGHLGGEKILRFRGPKHTHQQYAAWEIINSSLQIQEGLKPDIDPKELRGCYVFFGYTATALHDIKVTPVGAIYPGVEIHATALDNLLNHDFIIATPLWAWVVSTVLLALLGALAGEWCCSGWQSGLSYALISPLPLAIGCVMYFAGYWWPIVAQTCAVLIALTGALALNFATEGQQRRFIKNMFSHYLSPLVIERLLADPSRLQLGGEKRELSIFFSDLQGFTTISEKMDPQDLAALLNDYLTDMTDIIMEEGGTVDKFEGDAIIAFWNAPLDVPDHPIRACRAALRCQRKLTARREEFRHRTGHELHMRIGVHTGTVAVGNFGSQTRFDYTMLGDAANLAARLEGANKIFGSFTMVSEATWQHCTESIQGRELGVLRVVGRSEPVRVFEPVCFNIEPLPEQTRQFIAAYTKYQAGDWDAAADLFEKIPADPPAQAYVKYCRDPNRKERGQSGGVWDLVQK